MADGGRVKRDGKLRTEARSKIMELYKFQKLETYQLALTYTKTVYMLSKKLPDRERFNL